MTSNSHESWGTNEVFYQKFQQSSEKVPHKTFQWAVLELLSWFSLSTTMQFSHLCSQWAVSASLSPGSMVTAVPCNGAGRALGLCCLDHSSPSPSWPALTALWGTPAQAEKNPQSIPVRQQHFKHSETLRQVCQACDCAYRTSASIPHQDRSVSHRALRAFHTFLRAQIPSGFTLSKNFMCLPSLSELYLHPKSNLCTVSWREELSMVLVLCH